MCSTRQPTTVGVTGSATAAVVGDIRTAPATGAAATAGRTGPSPAGHNRPRRADGLGGLGTGGHRGRPDDDRRVERLLKATAATLHLGVGNYCWFTDPSKALCLKLAGTPQADQPMIGMCDSARCPQATHHAQHRPVWAEHAQNINSVFLGNPRLSKPEQARAHAAFDRAQRILADIDAADATLDEATAAGNTGLARASTMADKCPADVETRIRTAIGQLLGGDIPDGLKCDVKSLCALAGVPRATLYRTYPHLKAEFDRQRDAAQQSGQQPDQRLARIDRLKTEIVDLRARLACRDGEITELKALRDVALSRLAAQHEEITALRTQLQSANHAKIRTLPNR